MTAEQIQLARAECFAYQPTGRIPDPPLFNVDGLNYTVPPYYGFNHSETQWLINMIKANNWERIYRILVSNEIYLTSTYCQYPDSPDPSLGQPMFHRKAVLYLTPLALAIYLRQFKLAKKMMEYVNNDRVKVVNVNQPCFVTNYIERFEKRNDIMLIYPFCIMFRRECFECAHDLMINGWAPHEEIELPYRRISQVFVFHYKDIIEYCLAQMVRKPNLRLPKLLDNLIKSLHNNFSLLNFERIIVKMGNDTEIEDFVSIPRRMLRYIHYCDRDMRLISQIISSIRIVQESGFYIGPRRTSLDNTFTPPTTGTDEKNMVNDQDNSVSLILAICDEAELKGHSQARQKLSDLLAHILVDTHWLIHFIQKDSQTLSDYFSSLTERVRKIRTLTVDFARHRLTTLIDDEEINCRNIKELYDPEAPKRNWRESLVLFLERNKSESSKRNSSQTDNKGENMGADYNV